MKSHISWGFILQLLLVLGTLIDIIFGIADWFDYLIVAAGVPLLIFRWRRGL